MLTITLACDMSSSCTIGLSRVTARFGGGGGGEPLLPPDEPPEPEPLPDDPPPEEPVPPLLVLPPLLVVPLELPPPLLLLPVLDDEVEPVPELPEAAGPCWGDQCPVGRSEPPPHATRTARSGAPSRTVGL